MILPDHPTPVRLRTHTIDPVPFMIYSSEKDEQGISRFTEENAKNVNNYIPHGHDLMQLLVKKS